MRCIQAGDAVRTYMRGSVKRLVAVLLLVQLAQGSAGAFVLLPEPPAHGFAMNLNLPATPFSSIGYGLTSWRQLAEDALAKWNAAGIGSGPDFGFLRVAEPVVEGNPCARDGVNEVRWSPDNCGFSFGSVIAITNRWIVNGERVEEDVIFNSNVAYDAYQGQLIGTPGGQDTLNDFFRVAVHEFGHVAGLDHPDQAGQKVDALMNSQISNVDSLQSDDLDGARAIAWAGVSATSITTVATTTTTTIAASGQIGMHSYFPFKQGYEWTYQHEKSGSVTPSMYTRTVGHTAVPINGIMTYVWSDSAGVSRYMTNDADGVRRHANGSQGYVSGYGNVTVSSIYIPPELYVPAFVTLGDSLTQTGSIEQTASDGSSSSNSYSQSISFAAESISVPAGMFPTVRVNNLREISGVATTNTFWVADGVGIVKLTYEAGDGTTETFSLSAINFTPEPSAATLNLISGWNLVGNGSGGTLAVATAFGNPENVTSVWKWVAASGRWAFYTPSLAASDLASYADSRGYDTLTTIGAGEGFWVNAKTAFAAQLPASPTVTSLSYQSGLATGWNLIAIGDGKTPREFSETVSLSALWAWDASKANWYFYAPGLDAKGELAAYISAKSYLNFGDSVLAPTVGFWVDRP